MSKASGDWGEALVANYLRDRGYTLLAAGYRCRMGEIDLIAQKKGVICFVEVKTRSSVSHGLPREFVTPQKQRRLIAAAERYLVTHELDSPARFDVAEVYTDQTHTAGGSRIRYLENAFEKGS